VYCKTKSKCNFVLDLDLSLYSRKFIVTIPVRKPLIERVLLERAKDLFK